MNTPFKGAQVVLANGAPLEDLRFGKNGGRALDTRTGEFNAGSTKELVHALDQLMQAHASGQIRQAVASDEGYVAQTSVQQREARVEALAAAINDPVKWEALGSGIARKIYEQADRSGFLRRLSVPNVLKGGDVARVPMPIHEVMAVVATSASQIGYQTVRNKVFKPDEFEITANVRVEALDLEQINGDLLEEAYNQGLESIMTQEDRLWKEAADLTVGVINPLEFIVGELTTKNIGNLRQSVARWNLPTATMLIANDFWADIIGSNDFATFFDPITKYDLALNGQIGTLTGMTLITDAFRQQNQKVLNPGEIYVVASPENHASYTTRGGIRSTPTTGANDGSTARGWLLSNPFSFVLANSRSVGKGQRI